MKIVPMDQCQFLACSIMGLAPQQELVNDTTADPQPQSNFGGVVQGSKRGLQDSDRCTLNRVVLGAQIKSYLNLNA